ncbi:beta-carotene 15,15'-monooxygenase [Kaistella montana]|uniref:Beta-carotene 15,15'-monooxygenase n=1 Tax=Kaistella montana TaxID=1849733 RepID=A0ABW5K8H9_9FLAO|nr:beta-carotene 15,15'-monooxygenase [Kaistella montana]MCQ4034238.1 beta-carotene 15,15'-monooxygenase [Kaistella montana]
MPEFDLDNFKKTWQEQMVQPKYNSTEIEAMLNKSSRNYVKYILWISIAEFLVIFCMNLYYAFIGDDTNSFISILGKLGVKSTTGLENGFSNLYLGMKTISLVLTAFFVVKFFQNYRKINVESNLKKLILQIINFKKTVNLFILANIFLIILFTVILTAFTFMILSQQNIHLNNPTLIGFLVGTIVMMGISVVLIWVYYRLVYGIILKRLGKNLEELQRIDEQQQ